MAASSEWSVLKPWLTVLGPYLSAKASATDAHAFDCFVIQVSEMLGPLTRESPSSVRTTARLALMWEALELFSLALYTSNASSRQAVLELCSNTTLQQRLQTYSPHDWQPRVALAFRSGSQGDRPSALATLQVLASAIWCSEPTEEFTTARMAILSRQGVDTEAARSFRLRVSFHLQPPLKSSPDYMTSYLVAPSRIETMRYYDCLFHVLETTTQSSSRRPILDGLELNLNNLETPADAIPRLGDILALGIPIQKLALQLGYTWDVFDQETIVRVLNSTPIGRINHIAFAATTADNLEAALDSLPRIATIPHVELVDHVVFGNVAPSFNAAFRRVLLSSTTWMPKKLTLRGTHLEHLKVASSKCPSGLEELAMELGGHDIESFLRVLPRFGSLLRSLEIRATYERTGAISLVSIANSCPRLGHLKIHGAVIKDLSLVVEQECIGWTSLELEDVLINGLQDLDAFVKALGELRCALARKLTTFSLKHLAPLPVETISTVHDALERNKRLEHLTLGPVESPDAVSIVKFHGESLVERKYAFVSAVYSTERPLDSALASVDSWNLADIMSFAGLGRQRQVICIANQ